MMPRVLFRFWRGCCCKPISQSHHLPLIFILSRSNKSQTLPVSSLAILWAEPHPACRISDFDRSATKILSLRLCGHRRYIHIRVGPSPSAAKTKLSILQPWENTKVAAMMEISRYCRQYCVLSQCKLCWGSVASSTEEHEPVMPCITNAKRGSCSFFLWFCVTQEAWEHQSPKEEQVKNPGANPPEAEGTEAEPVKTSSSRAAASCFSRLKGPNPK